MQVLLFVAWIGIRELYDSLWGTYSHITQDVFRIRYRARHSVVSAVRMSFDRFCCNPSRFVTLCHFSLFPCPCLNGSITCVRVFNGNRHGQHKVCMHYNRRRLFHSIYRYLDCSLLKRSPLHSLSKPKTTEARNKYVKNIKSSVRT